jgi:acyl-CoA thioesterase-1
MTRFLALLILAGATAAFTGCRPDNGSKASSQFDQDNSAASSGPSNTNTPTRSATDTRPLVVCFGDSLTAGYGADDGQSYPDFLQKDLDADGFRYRVVNEGVSGNTTKDGVDRLNDVEALHPAVVVLEFGGNDGLRGIKVQTMRTNLATMIAGLQHAGATVVLAGITLPPDYGPDYVNSFTATYPLLAKKYGTPVLPFLLQNVYGVDGLMQADNTHATDKGNAVVAKNILPLVEPLLKK